ncbi:hypothetical protein RAD15_12060 [Bradyrhizobium sp. 14AA]
MQELVEGTRHIIGKRIAIDEAALAVQRQNDACLAGYPARQQSIRAMFLRSRATIHLLSPV